MSNCLFCKIAAGDIPSDCVYQDEYVYAFRDISPQSPVHILVIPKEHIASSALDISAQNSAVVGKCFEAIAKIARQEGLGSGFRVVNNCGEDGGQTVQHLHFHILGGQKLTAKII